MTKAIVWSLIGLPLGVMFGVGMGPGAGVLVATVATAAAGAVTWKRACRTACDGCPVVCKTPARSRASGVVTVVAGATLAAVVARAALGLAAPFLLPLEAVALGACVAARAGLLRLSPVLQRTGRLGLRSGPLAHRLAAQHSRPARVRPVVRPALTRGPLAIEAPKPAIRGAIIDARERTGHAAGRAGGGSGKAPPR